MFAILAVGAALVVLRLLFPLPDISQRQPDRALRPRPETVLGGFMMQQADARPGLSGVAPVRNGHDALASRLALIDRAEVSIDAQYYIWHDDTSGILLLDALMRAAARGVRVRLLLDDNGVPGMDGYLAALDTLDNIEVRLFNPSTIRRPKLLGYAIDFLRMNRRMHNKALIVDGAAAVVGGRNIGDEYFGLEDAYFVDLDVFAIGPVVGDTAEMFDDYWNSRSVFSVADIAPGDGDPQGLDARIAEVTASPETGTLVGELTSTAQEWLSGRQMLEWTRVALVADDPVKGEGRARDDQLMIFRLGGLLGQVQSRLDLVSAYFIPGPRGTEYFSAMAQQGVKVRILTNAMLTTDVTLVHSGYAKYREELLAAGVELFELKLRNALAPESESQLRSLGLSGASLHAKSFAVDGNRVFIGSFNFDPRSARLNCEMGFMIDSAAMAGLISTGFDRDFARISYRPRLSSGGGMIWEEEVGPEKVVTFDHEPGTTWFDRVQLKVLGLLPIEWLL